MKKTNQEKCNNKKLLEETKERKQGRQRDENL